MSSEFGLLPWFEEHGARYADPQELPKLATLQPYGKVLRLAARERDALLLAYGEIAVRVHVSAPFSPVPSPKFWHGAQVKVVAAGRARCSALVREVRWHEKQGREFYLLRCGPRNLPSRYWPEELAPDVGSREVPPLR